MQDSDPAQPRPTDLTRRDFLIAAGQVGAGTLASSAFARADLVNLTRNSSAPTHEYAAGEVTLPFVYSMTPSPMPQPECLNFSHQVSPDNCQVFVRIEDELWEFRSQWVINLGTTARWKGPDIDHMTRVEDGTYPDGMTSCWFLGGMWYDDAERKLYAPMHIEHDNIRREYPFSRKIALATSTDKGSTWQYEGDIITSETYYYPHEFYKFSGSGFGIGLADFGFYVDRRGGYFYIFPDEAWGTGEPRVTRWNTRAARCAIGDKMAPGKWKNFYDGTWEQPALGGKSSTVAPSHLWGISYCTALNKYVCMFLGNADPPDQINTDGVYIGACTDLGKQDWVWGYCPEAMFGFMNIVSVSGTDPATTCIDAFRYYSYWGPNDFQRIDVKFSPGKTAATGLQSRYMFEPHPESSDPMLGRVTKIVASDSKEMRYSGNWIERANPSSYEGKSKESAIAGSSVEFSFEGPAIYWRALHSPQSGKADVYIDEVFRKTVDCYSPRSTSYEQFMYVATGISPDNAKHTIRVVVLNKKHPDSTGSAINHIAFEYSAESYKVSAGFSGMMGKNQWFYQQKIASDTIGLTFTPDEAHPRMYWSGSGLAEVGPNYQVADDHPVMRTWVAPHGGIVRVEGFSSSTPASSIWLNHKKVWPDESDLAKPRAHDLNLTVIQGDSIVFQVLRIDPALKFDKVIWDPIITFVESVPAVLQLNPPGAQNLALDTYARSKVLVSSYRPFDAVDGNLNTSFTIHADDQLSTGDDWLEVDLEKTYRIDRYVVASQSADRAYRPTSFTLQKSDDGFTWSDVSVVADDSTALAHYFGVPMTRFIRDVPPFQSRYVRLYLPKGKPFTITEFELYYTQGKTSFGPPAPAGE